jgi:hypothetical protein
MSRAIRFVYYIGLGVLITSALLISCGKRIPKTVKVKPSYLGYLLLTDKPVPVNPDEAEKVQFEHVGKAKDGTRCVVLGMAEGYGDVFFELACEGLREVGWLPADAVEIIEYWEKTPAYTEIWTPAN